jgi:tripartite-type tricarboxylate transporter receptor subunit TctC
MSITRRLFIVSALSSPAAASRSAWAASWPMRPIRFIVSFAAGATPDILCRLVTQRLGQALGQQIYIENRAGGSNVVGAQAAARAAPDGYTFYWATAAALVTNPYTFAHLSYDPLRDFTPVGKVADGPFLVLANPQLSAQTFMELIALAKANPGRLTFATDGPRNFSGMIAAWINKLAGIETVQVPYPTMPQGIQDTIAGRVQLTIVAIPSAVPFIQSGALRPLAISMKNRAPGYEDIPPIADTLPGFDFSGWMAVVAPSKTPAGILQRMNREMDNVLRQSDIAQRLREMGFYTTGAGGLDETREFVLAQFQSWGKVVKEIGIQPE